MNRQDHLLVRAMEECNELAQRISKALVFGMEEVQPGQTLTNLERIYGEYFDLRAVLGMAGIDAWVKSDASMAAERAKVAKVEHYLRYSGECGRVEAGDAAGTPRVETVEEHEGRLCPEDWGCEEYIAHLKKRAERAEQLLADAAIADKESDR